MSELIDREAVREFIKSYSHSTDVAFHMEDHLDEIPAAQRWHRVEDELPKEVGSYLTAYCDGFVCENQWHYIGSTAIGWVNDAEAVRYWMPLPKPPKEDT